MNNEFIKNIQVGDTVIVHSGRYGNDIYTERTVTRFTKTQIIIEYVNISSKNIISRFRRGYDDYRAGREVGGDEYHPSKLISPLDESYLHYLKKVNMSELKDIVRKAIDVPEGKDEIDGSISQLKDLAAYIGIQGIGNSDDAN